ncbi:hypothetical protein [Ensifer aridi]|uniref:hypothetical protein n=1 Tax=Ensifer aridi TaxID=1708715 RepID=UPI000A111924|nr:hypothetical protein [Ensifer aridi]
MTKPNWKDTFRDGMFECAELRHHRSHLNLLSYIVHKANSKSYFCWTSQREMARVHGCSVRNIKELLNFLHKLGAVHPVRFADLPRKNQDEIEDLCGRPVKRNANVYYVSVQWAKDALADRDGSKDAGRKPRQIKISADARRKGYEKLNDRRRRYAPAVAEIFSPQPTNAQHEEHLFLNAIDEKWGGPTSPILKQQWGSPTTDISIENNQDASSAPNNDRAFADSEIPFSEEEVSTASISSLPDQQCDRLPHGYGAGEAGAGVPRTPSLGGFGLQAHEQTPEYDAARVREGKRRAS